MTGGGPIPVREYASVEEMRRRAADLHRACFAPRPPPPPRIAPVVMDRIVTSRSGIPSAFVEATLAQYGVPDLRSAQQRAGTAVCSGRHCLLVVVSLTDIPTHAIRGRSRAASLIKARFIACWLMRHYADKSTPVIGALVQRDHSTVLSALARVDQVVADLRLTRSDRPEAMAEVLWRTDWPILRNARNRPSAANRAAGGPPC